MLNPLLVKELRIKARRRDIRAVSIIYILMLSALAFSLFWLASTGSKTLDAEYGRGIFLNFVLALMLAICLICPAFTAGAISSEREWMTFGQLRVTLLRPYQILMGKFVPSLVYILILLLASIPIAILIMSLSGVSLVKAAHCYLIVFAAAFAFSLIGLICSSIYKKTQAAMVATYTIVSLFAFGTAIIPMILTSIFKVNIDQILLDWIVVLSPFHVMFTIMGKGRQFQLAGMASWNVALVVYIAISVIANFIILLRLKRIDS